jgi:hydrogenase maturation protein HypF
LLTLAAGVAREKIAARFHNGTAGVIADCCGLLVERTGSSTGIVRRGVPEPAIAGQRRRLPRVGGFTVLTHSRVPCNDGGISLGQAVVAAARTSPDGPGDSF